MKLFLLAIDELQLIADQAEMVRSRVANQGTKESFEKFMKEHFSLLPK